MESMRIKQEYITEYNEFFHPNSNQELLDLNMLENKCGEIYLQSNYNVVILCTYCSTQFTHFVKFLIHLRENHSDKDIEGSKLDPSESNERNIKIETNIETFPFIDIAKISPDRIESDSDLVYTSSVRSKSSRDNHQNTTESLFRSRYTRKDFTVNLNKRSTSHVQKSTNNSPVRCKVCNIAFSSKIKLEEHKSSDHKSLDILSDSSNGFSDTESKKELSSMSSKTSKPYTDPLKCSFCNRRNKSKIEKIEHERIHTGEKPLKCEKCSKCFRSKALLNLHIKTHTEIKPHKCELCNASFRDKSNLSMHIRRHTGERNIKCRYCEKLFYQNTERRQHERIHTGEKPYQCNECGQCFQTCGKLTLHSRRHKGEKPFKCDSCDRCFCTKPELIDHTVVHTGERPFSCEVCNATFPRRKALKSHLKIHSDVVGYICKICGKGFKQNPGLYSHMKSHGTMLTKTKSRNPKE